MERVKNLHWPLVLGLGALALARPLMNIVGLMDQLGRPLGPLLITVVISVVWVAAVGLTRITEPVLTLVFVGIAYAVFAIVLSGILSPILTGQLQGPLANPIAILPVILTNVAWGAVTGVLAMALQKLRRGGHGSSAGPSGKANRR